MDLTYLRKLIKILDQSNLNEIEIEEEGVKIRLVKSSNSQVLPQAGYGIPTYQISPAQQQVPATPESKETKEPATSAEVVKEKEVEEKFHEVKSPIVGTFYRAPAPDADPYVEVGQIVQPGTVLCIVEAMKLMNEIESDVGGRIVKILIENGQPVEYNQTLFLIEPL